MRIYRVVRRKSGLDEWQPVPGAKHYVHPQIAKGQRTRMDRDQDRWPQEPRWTYAVQVAETTDWVTML